MKRFLILFVLAFSVLCLNGKELRTTTPSESSYFDTEVETNIVFNTLRNDVKIFSVVLEFSPAISNCLQVAFGKDDDNDGDLSYGESDLIIGWRNGDYFIESDNNRISAPQSSEQLDCRRIELIVRTDFDISPKLAFIKCDGEDYFSDINSSNLTQLFNREWNLLKLTRRGRDNLNDNCYIKNDYYNWFIIVR